MDKEKTITVHERMRQLAEISSLLLYEIRWNSVYKRIETIDKFQLHLRLGKNGFGKKNSN